MKAMMHIFRNHRKAAVFLVNMWHEKAAEKIRAKGRFTVALSGGKTPEALYDLLGKDRENPAWKGTHIFLVDERFVPHDHPDSNYRMVREHLMEPLGWKIGSMHCVQTEAVSAETAAEKYADDLYSFFGSRPDFPEFDMIMLGIGKDGHTASLFPGSPALDERHRLAVAVHEGRISHKRITLSLPVINHAGEIIFFVIGKDKAPILRTITAQGAYLPASRVCPEKGRLSYILDQEAAAELDPEAFQGRMTLHFHHYTET